MSNQNKQNVEEQNKQETVEQKPVQNAPAAEPAPVVQQNAVPEQKKGFGGWLKEHWKGATAAVIAVGTAVGTGIAAYRKGKAAGAAAASMPVEQEDYSLNPNE